MQGRGGRGVCVCAEFKQLWDAGNPEQNKQKNSNS